MTLRQGETIAEAIRHIDSGNAGAAERIAKKLLKRNARDVHALRIIALAASLRHDADKAVSMLKRCMQMMPDFPLFHRDMGKVLLMAGKFDASLEAYDRYLKEAPDDLDAVLAKSDVLEKSGRFDEAHAALRPFLEGDDPPLTVGLLATRLHLRREQYHEGIRQGLQFVNTPHHARREVGMLWETIGHCHERLGEFEEAFNAFSHANKAMAMPFNREEHLSRINELMAIFTRRNLSQLPRGRDQSELPVFIVAMPRSGSTLVEQIIHAHPEAHGAGELPNLPRLMTSMQESIGSFQSYPACIADLTQAHVDRLAQTYLRELRRVAPGKKRIVDKQLDSYAHLGMISLLFPKARAIYVEREPMDNCFSIFMANLDANSIRYSTRLADIGFVHTHFTRMIEHWRRELDFNMLHVKYEALVADPEPWVRKIIDFVGLKWNDACLRHHEAKRDVLTLSYDQVRRPIYQSAVARWRRYEPFLGELKSALDGAGPAAAAEQREHA